MKILIILLLAVSYSYVLEDKIDHVPVIILLFRDTLSISTLPFTPAILILILLIELPFMFLCSQPKEKEITIHSLYGSTADLAVLHS